jgi:hypothetical protein
MNTINLSKYINAAQVAQLRARENTASVDTAATGSVANVLKQVTDAVKKDNPKLSKDELIRLVNYTTITEYADTFTPAPARGANASKSGKA